MPRPFPSSANAIMEDTDPDVGASRISRSCRGVDFDSSGRSTLILGMDSDLLGLQCGIFSIDSLSALCPLWERKERNKEKKRPKRLV